MKFYFVEYEDNAGFNGKTLIESPTTLCEDQIINAINEQLEENSINAQVIKIKVKETNKILGNVTHFLANTGKR